MAGEYGVGAYGIGGYGGSAAVPPPPVPIPVTSLWSFKAIDTMKDSMDTVGNQLTDAQIAGTIQVIALMHPTHITVNTFYDYPDYMAKWVAAVRAVNCKVWFRCHWNHWEGNNGQPADMTPATYITDTVAFVNAHPTLFQSGDIFDPNPEQENSPYWPNTYGGSGWGWDYANNPNVTTALNAYNAFLLDLSAAVQSALQTNNVMGVITGIRSTGGWWAGRSQSLYTATTNTLGYCTYDDYPESDTTDPAVAAAARLTKQAEVAAARPNTPIILGEFGYSIHLNVSDSVQRQVLEEILQAIQTRPEIVGINYWVGPGKLSNNDYSRLMAGDWVNGWTLRPAGLLLAQYYSPLAVQVGPHTWTVRARAADSLLASGDIDDYVSLEMTMRFNSIGAFALTIPGTSKNSALLPLGAGIVVYRDGLLFFSGQIRSVRREGGLGGTYTAAGPDDMIWLVDRQAWPATSMAGFATQAYDIRVGVAETLLRGYVSDNLGPTAIAERRVPHFTLENAQTRGNATLELARFAQMLSQDGEGLLQRIARAGGVGFRIVQVGTSLQFQVYVPADKTSNVILSPLLGNLSDWAYTMEYPVATEVIVGGSGEGTARIFREKFGADYETYGRIEAFQDARDTSDTTTLDARGADTLVQAGVRAAMQIKPLDTESMQYGRDYGLGDRVTIITDPGSNAVIGPRTAFAIFGTVLDSTTLATAAAAITQGTQSGAAPPNSPHHALVGTATGWGELWAGSDNDSPWAEGVAPAAPTGHGILLDGTFLEGRRLAAGDYQAFLRINCSNGAIYGLLDLTARFYIRHSDGSYTLLAISSGTNYEIDNSYSGYMNKMLSATAASASPVFVLGDNLYVDVWARVVNQMLPVNMLTDNQASVETDLTGIGGQGGITPTRDNAHALHGTWAIKVVTDSVQPNEGFSIAMPATSFVDGTAYTFSVYAYGAGNVKLIANRSDTWNVMATSSTTTLDASWKRLSVTWTHPANLPDNYNVYLDMETDGAQTVTWWADQVQVEKGSSASVWYLPSMLNARINLRALANAGSLGGGYGSSAWNEFRTPGWQDYTPGNEASYFQDKITEVLIELTADREEIITPSIGPATKNSVRQAFERLYNIAASLARRVGQLEKRQ